MSIRRWIGLVLVIVGIVAFVNGGFFWTDRDTVLDAGPIQVTTEDREGIRLPVALGAVLVVGGILLLVIPDRRRV